LKASMRDSNQRKIMGGHAAGKPPTCVARRGFARGCVEKRPHQPSGQLPRRRGSKSGHPGGRPPAEAPPFSFPACGGTRRLRRQDAEANGEAGPKGVPQERHARRMGALLILCSLRAEKHPTSPGSNPGQAHRGSPQAEEATGSRALRAAAERAGPCRSGATPAPPPCRLRHARNPAARRPRCKRSGPSPSRTPGTPPDRSAGRRAGRAGR
jgi:hypothetical protein